MSAADEKPPVVDPQAATPAQTEHPNAPPEDKPAAPAPEPPPPKVEAPKAVARREEPPPPLAMDSDNVIDLWRLAGFLCESELLPGKLSRMTSDRARNNVFLMMLVGKDRGLSPLQSISGGLHVIEGKVEIGAHAMVALCLKSAACEYLAPISALCDETKAVYRTRRRGWPEGHYEDFTFTIDDAARMGLLDKGKDEYKKAQNPWRKMPGVMLRRRCATGISREYYPDVVLGLYDHGEVQDVFDTAPDLVVMPPGTDVSGAKPAGVPITEAPYKTKDPLADRVREKADRRRQEEMRVERDVESCTNCGTPDASLVLGLCPACRR